MSSSFALTALKALMVRVLPVYPALPLLWEGTFIIRWGHWKVGKSPAGKVLKVLLATTCRIHAQPERLLWTSMCCQNPPAQHPHGYWKTERGQPDEVAAGVQQAKDTHTQQFAECFGREITLFPFHRWSNSKSKSLRIIKQSPELSVLWAFPGCLSGKSHVIRCKFTWYQWQVLEEFRELIKKRQRTLRRQLGRMFCRSSREERKRNQVYL